MRRGFLSKIAPAGVIVAVVAATAAAVHTQHYSTVQPAAAANSPWAQSDGNASGNRANLTETTLSTTTVKKIVYRRSITVAPLPVGPSCESAGAVSPPALSGGRVYTAADDYVAAYSASTGAVVWQTKLDPSVDTTPGSIAVGNGLVYVQEQGCESPDDPGNELDAFNATTGKHVWAAGVSSDGGSMQLSGNYIVLSGAPATDGASTVVYQATTGAQVWMQYDDCYDGTSAIVVAAEVVRVNCDEDGSAEVLEADSLSTGAVLWQQPGSWHLIRGDNDGATTGHHIYAINGTGPVTDLNPKTGLARFTLPSATEVLADDASRVYGVCADDTVCAFDVATGAREWTDSELVAGNAAEADGVLYLGDGNALSASTGSIIKQAFPYGPAPMALAIGDGHLAVSTTDRIIDLYGLAGS